MSRVFATYNRAAQSKASGIAQPLQVFSHLDLARKKTMPRRHICSHGPEINFISGTARSEMSRISRRFQDRVQDISEVPNAGTGMAVLHGRFL
jgi:hypothetical protein